MNDAPPLQWRNGNVNNAAILDRNVANRIQVAFWIDDASTFDHGVILLREQNRCA